MNRTTDVVVIGAGFSGLAAAHSLAGRGLQVTVLEANDRVGGRTYTDPEYEGGPLDLGGMFVGATHHRSRALGESLGFETVSARPGGLMTFRVDGRVVRATDGGYPKALGEYEDFDATLSAAYGTIDELASQVGAAGPWDNAEHLALDRQTAATWVSENIHDPLVREIIRLDLSVYFGADLSEMSALFLGQFVAKCEGMQAVQVTAQDQLWLGGSQQICEQIAKSEGITVFTSSPAQTVEWDDNNVSVEHRTGRVTARALVLAVPLSAAVTIRFTPELPRKRYQLHQRAAMGREMKFQIRYPQPFWRDAGLSGEIFDADLGCLAFDGTRPGDELATMVGFIGGYSYDSWIEKEEDERKALFIELLADAFGPQARSPLSYVEMGLDNRAVHDGRAGGVSAARTAQRRRHGPFGLGWADPLRRHRGGTDVDRIHGRRGAGGRSRCRADYQGMVNEMSAPFTALVPAGMEESGPRYGMSPGVQSGELIFVSGQLGIDADGTIPSDGARQAELAFEALARVLAAAGATLKDIIQLQTFQVGSMLETNEWFLPVKSKYITAPYPSWTGFGVVSLGGEGAVIEIGAIARIPEQGEL